MNYVFESLMFNLLVINYFLMSESQLFIFDIVSTGCLDLKETYIWLKHDNKSYDTLK